MEARGRSGGIRFLSDRLIDEDGNVWDRVRGELYELNADELQRLAPNPVRHLETHGFGSSVTELTAEELERRARAVEDPRITAYRRPSVGAIWVLNDSDC